MPPEAERALSTVAVEIVARGALAAFMSAIVGGALVALLSFMLQAVQSVGSRIALAFSIGFLLAVGPFDHVVVTVLHVFFGLLFGAAVDFLDMAKVLGISVAGNLVGGVGLVTLSHIAQAKGASES